MVCGTSTQEGLTVWRKSLLMPTSSGFGVSFRVHVHWRFGGGGNVDEEL